jgi:predicted kinase
MTPTLHIPVGIPGCGKSYHARNCHAVLPDIISTDQIRIDTFGSLEAAHADPANNSAVFDCYHRKIRSALDHGRDTYADATNLHSSSRRTLRDIARRTGARTQLYFFTDVVRALQRNEARVGALRVPDDVMDKMIGQQLVAAQAIPAELYTKVEIIDSWPS